MLFSIICWKVDINVSGELQTESRWTLKTLKSFTCLSVDSLLATGLMTSHVTWFWQAVSHDGCSWYRKSPNEFKWCDQQKCTEWFSLPWIPTFKAIHPWWLQAWCNKANNCISWKQSARYDLLRVCFSVCPNCFYFGLVMFLSRLMQNGVSY